MSTRTDRLSTTPRRLRQLLLVALGQQELGQRIKAAREESGLTQSQLAERLGLGHSQSISNYERGATEVPQKRLRRIAEITGKPLVYFIGEPAETDPGLAEEVRALREQLERLIERLDPQDAARES